MTGCLSYIQIFLGWLILNVATFCMVLVPHSVQLLNVSPTLNDDDKYVVFGLWVLVEIFIFFILLVTATLIMCTCARVPNGSGFMHLMVDPGFLVVGCLPFLLIRGLPRTSSLHHCLNAPLLTASPHVARHTHLAGTAFTMGVFGVNLSRSECLSVVFLPAGNTTALAQHVPATELELRQYLSYWMTLMQCALPLPVLIRVLRFRWKMAWQPFLHSTLYVFLQTVDMANMVVVSVWTSDHRWSMGLEVLLYLQCLVVCVTSLGLAIPPIYAGNHISNRYQKALFYVGTAFVDLPLSLIRVALSHGGDLDTQYVRDGIFFLMLMKEVVFVGAAISLTCRRITKCVGTTYRSLNVHESSECEDCEGNEMEDFV